jgi:hypothetical protein
MKNLSRILAIVAALVAVVGLNMAPADASRLKSTGLVFNTGAPALGATAGARYVPGVTSNRDAGGDLTPIVITVSGPCTVAGPTAGFYTVTYSTTTSGYCYIKATQAAANGYAAGSATQVGFVIVWPF